MECETSEKEDIYFEGLYGVFPDNPFLRFVYNYDILIDIAVLLLYYENRRNPIL